MKRFFGRLLISFFFVAIFPSYAKADISGLTRCSDSPIFARRLDQSVKKLNSRLTNYEPGTPAYLAIEKQIQKTQTRFDKYGKQKLLCGVDGLPHLIADGRWSHAGEFLIPGFLFLYISGWIGWVGRSYLAFTKNTDKPNENEIIIDVPVAIGMMSSGFLWPLAAWKELISGKLFVSSSEITVSPR